MVLFVHPLRAVLQDSGWDEEVPVLLGRMSSVVRRLLCDGGVCFKSAWQVGKCHQ